MRTLPRRIRNGRVPIAADMAYILAQTGARPSNSVLALADAIRLE